MPDLSQDRIAVRHRTSGAVTDIARSSLLFFPDYELIPDEALPAKSATKADWKAYAAGHGLTEDEAEAMTRDQLVAHFHPDTQES